TLPVASLLLYFFSSRRRHTRFSRDWSSDVCSSDLVIFYTHLWRIASRVEAGMFQLRGRANDFHDSSIQVKIWCTVSNQLIGNQEIGRASCRERVELSGSAVRVEGSQ